MVETNPVVSPGKVRQPKVPRSAIPREGLQRRLDSVYETPLTLVTAPAGFGKSWVVAQWLQHNEATPRAWVGLDSMDGDPMRLWMHIVAAVRGSTTPDAADRAWELLQHSDAGWPFIVDALSGGLAAQIEHFIVVLDDCHKLTGTEALASLEQFLSQLPPQVHVICVGRMEPAARLARFRVSGSLTEIRTADLRCTQEECLAVVAAMGLDLPNETVDTLRVKTMGWITGIRLAAVASDRDDDHSAMARELVPVSDLTGAYQDLGDYLVEEVLAHLDEATRHFLTDTSILSDLTVDLCNVVAGVQQSAGVLEGLARAGMFTSRSDESGSWYRYHDLFRGALEQVLHRTDPERERALHRRAAGWLHANGHAVMAVTHALAAADVELAQQLLIEASEPLLAARQIDTLATLFDDMDRVAPQMHASSLMHWAGAILYSSRPAAEIDRVLERLRRRLDTMEVDEQEQAEQAITVLAEPFHNSLEEFRLAVIATIAHRRGDHDLALASASDLRGRASENGWIEASAGEALIQRGRFSEGIDLVQPWHEYCLAAENETMGVVNLAHCLSIIAFGRIGQGRLTEADQLVDRALASLQERGLNDRPQYAVGALPAAWVAWERGNLQASQDLLAAVTPRLERLGELPAEVSTHILLARISRSLDDSATAWIELDAAATTRSGHTVSADFANLLSLERARLALLDGDIGRLHQVFPEWQGRLEHGATTMSEHLVLSRAAIMAGLPSEQYLRHVPQGAEVTILHELEREKLRALAAQKAKDESGALDHLTEALTIAARTGHRQTFLDDRPLFGALLDNAAARAGFLLYLEGSSPPPEVEPARNPVSRLPDPLTGRELEVLRLLPSHLTYKEIGERLFVSANTVKSHVKAVYRKLDAEHRNEAVERARALGLVP